MTKAASMYYDEGGRAMLGSALFRDPKFQDRVVAVPLSRFGAERRTP